MLSLNRIELLSKWNGKLTLGKAGGYFQWLPKSELEEFRVFANEICNVEHYKQNMCCGEAVEAVEVCFEYWEENKTKEVQNG